MAIDTKKLARAVVSWVEFESLCRRDRVLSEASLAQPIGGFLIAHSAHELLPEEQHPVLPKIRRPPQIDFAIRRPDKSFSLALETKWVNGKRDIKQELIDDILRLELVHVANRQVARLLLVAGLKKHLDKQIFNAVLGKGRTATSFAANILPSVAATPITVDLGASTGGHRKLWKEAPHLSVGGVDEWPKRLKVHLETVFPAKPLPDDVTCYIWGIGRVQNRRTVTL
ncbi:hypothetical protein WMF20_41980 [Sorangium sp. So ce834]|uniref:hypothetical protein n=1 Tax=Sorangium sp. So ce834 TaxID=3133321 RepID=UPI003F6268DB